jgi:hypothetical protein
MSDVTINRFVASGDAAAMAAFTPDPPTPASGPDAGAFFFRTDTSEIYCWDAGTAAWVLAGTGSSGSGTVTNTGTLTAGQLIVGNGGVDVTVGNLSGDVTTSGSAATTIANTAVSTAKIANGAVTLAKIASAAANSRLLGSGSGGSGSAYTELTVGAGLAMGASSLTTSTTQRTRQLTFIIDGGGSAITTGVKVYALPVEYACTITAATLVADASGSCVLDILKCARGSYAGSLASIVASAPPTLSSAITSQDTTLTGWTTSISADDVLRVSVTSASTVKWVALVLTVTVS